MVHTWVKTEVKLALFDFATRLLENNRSKSGDWVVAGSRTPDSKCPEGPLEGLRRRLTKWSSGQTQLDRSYFAVQGPRYREDLRAAPHGACPGKGWPACWDHRRNHRSIENVLREVIKVFTAKEISTFCKEYASNRKERSQSLTALCTATQGRPPIVTLGLSPEHPWLFSTTRRWSTPGRCATHRRGRPVRIGRHFASSRAAHSLILLGDPLQLSQVTKPSIPAALDAMPLGM